MMEHVDASQLRINSNNYCCLLVLKMSYETQSILPAGVSSFRHTSFLLPLPSAASTVSVPGRHRQDHCFPYMAKSLWMVCSHFVLKWKTWLFCCCKLAWPRGFLGFPGGASGKEPSFLCMRHKRCRYDPWVRKILWRRAWQHSPVFLPGESHGQRSLVDYSWTVQLDCNYGCKELDMTKAT